jgi:carbonyl reductase 1
VDTNYYGTKNVTLALLPFINSNGRIVNVTSMAGVLGNSYSQDLKKIFEKETLPIEELDELVEKFVEGVKNDNFVELGFPKSTYKVSKAAENAFTRILARKLKKEGKITVNGNF